MHKSISLAPKTVVTTGVAPSIQRVNVCQNVAMRMVFCVLMLAVWVPSLMAVAPQISSLSIHDNDGDGWVDQVDLTFDVAVLVTDSDPADGFAPINLGGLQIAPGDYSGNNLSTLSVNILKAGPANTGEFVQATYSAVTGLGSIADATNGTAMNDGETSISFIDSAAPVILEIFNVDAASGEAQIKFSEPVVRSTGSILTISDFNYGDVSTGGASAISAMGSDADASDGSVKVLLNSAFLAGDIDSDTLSAVGLMDGNGNYVNSTPVAITERTLSGGLVEVEVHPSPIQLGGNEKFMDVVISSQTGAANVQSLKFDILNVTSTELPTLYLAGPGGNALSPVVSPVAGGFSINFNDGLLVDHSGVSVSLMGNMALAPSGNFTIFVLPSQFLMANGNVNGGSQPDFPALFDLNATPPVSTINLVSNPGFVVPTQLGLNAVDVPVMSFKLNAPSAQTVSGFTVDVSPAFEGKIISASLSVDGSIVASAFDVSTDIMFSSLAQGVSGADSIWQVSVDLASDFSGATDGMFTVGVSSFTGTASSVVGGPVVFTIPVGGVAPDLYGQAYGPVPTDAGLDRVIIEYGHYNGLGFTFYTEVQKFTAGTKDIASATLVSPQAISLNYVMEEAGIWSVESKAVGNVPYTSAANMDADFGSGNYTLTVNYSDASSDSMVFYAAPTIVPDVMTVNNPGPNSVIPVDNLFPVDWTYGGSANLFQVTVETFDGAPVSDYFSMAFDGSTFMGNVFRPIADGTFIASVNYELGVAAVTVDNAFVVTTANGDQVSVATQRWEEHNVPVNTSAGTSSINLVSNPSFVVPTQLGLNALDLPVMSFKLNAPSAQTVSGLTVDVSPAFEGKILSASLSVDGSIVASAFDVSTDIMFSSLAQGVSGADQIWQVSVDLASDFSGATDGVFSVAIGSFTATANVVGAPITYTIPVQGGTGSSGDLFGQAYGPVPTDAGLDRVIIEYGHYNGRGFGFWSELQDSPSASVNITSATLISPTGTSLNYVLLDGDEFWTAESLNSGNVFYASVSDLDADFGSGNYTLTVNYSNSSSDSMVFNVTPVINPDVMSINTPLAGSQIPVDHSFLVDWTYAGSANLFHVKVKTPNGAPVDDYFSMAFGGSAFMGNIFRPTDKGMFIPLTNYDLGVAAVTVDNAFDVATSNGDQVSVITQRWEEHIIPVNTAAGTLGVTPDLAFNHLRLEFYQISNGVFGFSVYAEAMGANIISFDMTSPDTSVYSMQFEQDLVGGGKRYYFETIDGTFTTPTELFTAFPTGVYTFSLGNDTNQTLSVNVHMPVTPTFGSIDHSIDNLFTGDILGPFPSLDFLGTDPAADVLELVFNNVDTNDEVSFFLAPGDIDFAVDVDPISGGNYSVDLIESAHILSPGSTVLDANGDPVPVEMLISSAFQVPNVVVDAPVTNPNLQPGLSVLGLDGEVVTDQGFASAGANVDVTLVFNATQSTGNGFNVLEVEFPQGFAVVGPVTASLNGLSDLTSAEGVVVFEAADPAQAKPALARVTFQNVQGDGFVYVYATLKAPLAEVEGFFFASVSNTGYSQSEFFAQPADVNGDGIGGELSLSVFAPQGTAPKLAGFDYELDVVGTVDGPDIGFVDTDATPIWRLHVAPDAASATNGFDLIRVGLPLELGDDLPANISVFTANAANVADSSTWTSLTVGSDYEIQAIDSLSFTVKFLTQQTVSDARYIIAFGKKVTPYPSFMTVDVVLNDSANFGEVFGVVGNAAGRVDNNDGGFHVEGSFSTLTNASFVTAELKAQGEIFTGNVAKFDVYVKMEFGASDEGLNTFKFYYPHDLESFQLLSVQSTNVRNSQTVSVEGLVTGNNIASTFYTTSVPSSGQLEIDFTQTFKTNKILRFRFQASTPSYPIFAELELEANNTSNFSPVLVFPGAILSATDVISLGFNVKPDFAFEDLKEIVVDGEVELLVAPQVGADGNVSTFVTPSSQPKFSVVLKTKVDSTTAGFDVLGMFAPSGFTLPQSYAVYKAPTLGTLGSPASLIASSNLTINKNDLADGLVKLEFKKIQGISSSNVQDGYVDGVAYYRIDFTPTAPEFESFGELDLYLTNKTNPLEFVPVWAALATPADVGMDPLTALDNDGMSVDVLVPYNPNVKPVVDDVIAEVNIKVSGNVTSGLDLSTDGLFVMDIKSSISDNTLVSGFDRIAIDVPFGFSAPTSVTLEKITNGVSANVRVSSEFKTDLSRLTVRLEKPELDQAEYFYRVSFKSKAFDYASPAFFSVALNNSTALNATYAVDGDANGNVGDFGTYINDSLEIDVLQKAFATDGLSPTEIDDLLTSFFNPVADELTIEVTPGSVPTSKLAQAFSVYVKATNTDGQRGFNRLVIELPWDFGNVGSVKITQYTATGNTQMAVGLGLSEIKALPADPTYGNIIRVDFSSLVGVGVDALFRVDFTADMPDYNTSGEMFAFVDDKAQSLPTIAFPGNASSESTTDDSIVFVEPDLSGIDLSNLTEPLTEFVSEVVAGNAIVNDAVTGSPETGLASFMDIYFRATKSSDLKAGFNFLEIFMPYPIDGNRLTVSDIKVSSVLASNFVDNSSFVRIDPTTLKINKADFSVSVKFNAGVNIIAANQPTLFRVRIPVVAPDFSGIYDVGLRAFSTDNPGVDAYPVAGDAVAGIGEDTMEVNVNPFLPADFDATKFPVEFVEAESFPNYAPTLKSTRFTVAARIEVNADNDGYNQFKVDLPPGFGKPGAVSVVASAISPRQLEPSKYSVKATTTTLLVTLLDQTIVSDGNIHYTTISFDSVTPEVPDFGFFDLSVGSSANPFLAVPAAWSDVNPDNGDGSMTIDIFPDFTNITFVPPLDDLSGEVNALPVTGTGEVLAGSTARVSVHLRATSDSGTAGGFNLVKLFVDSAFGTFPNKVNVVVTDRVTGSVNTLLAGTSTGYELDTANPAVPLIKFKQVYGSVDMKITFDIQAPEEAGEYIVDFAADNRAVPFDFFPISGLVNLDGDDTDGNSLFVEVHPQPIVFDANVYVVDSLVAEVVAATDLKVNAGGKMRLAVKAMNTSGNGFNRLVIEKSEFLTFSNLNGLSVTNAAGTVTNLVKDVNFTVVSEDERVILKFNTIQLTAAGNATYRVDMSVNAPDFPTELRFDVAVDNTSIRRPVYAVGGDANGVLTDRNNLYLNVEPDFAAALGNSLTLKDNIDNLTSEVVYVNGSQLEKKAEASSSNTIRVYIRPEFLADNSGVNKFTISIPSSFSKPSNVVVYSDNTISRTKLDKGNVDYKAIIGNDNSITIDFSGAQRTTYKLLDFNSTLSNTVTFDVEFSTVLPETPRIYFVGVEADNKSIPLPIQAVPGDVNGNNDDDGDGLESGLNDNSNFIFVVPQKVSAADFAARANAESAVAEVVGAFNGELGRVTEMSIATKVVVGATGNINRLYLGLPSEFSGVTGFKLDMFVGGSATGTRLANITDYTTDLTDTSRLKIRLKQGIVQDVVLQATFNVTLANRSAEFTMAAAVDNSATPKLVEAVPGNALDGKGVDNLFFNVDPAAFTAEDLTKSMMSAFTATVASPASIQVNKSTTVTMNLVTKFVTGDQGFDLLEVFSAGMSGFNAVKILVTPEGGQERQLFENKDYKVYATGLGGSIAFNNTASTNLGLPRIFSSNMAMKLSFTAKAGKDPISATYHVVAASTSLPVTTTAVVPTVGTLGVLVVPAPKSPAELKARPAKPVASLEYDVTPTTGIAGNVVNVDIFVRATSDAGSTINGEIVPASSGFDLVSVDLPNSFSAVSKLKLFHTVTGSPEVELQNVTDYSYSIDDKNRVSLTLIKNLMETSSLTLNTSNFRIRVSATLPSQPNTVNLFVAVNNSRTPQEVKASQVELSGDSVPNRKILVDPAPVLVGAVTKSIASVAIATVVYGQDSSGNSLTADVSQKGYAYTLRMKVASTPDTIGFNQINLTSPDKFKNTSVAFVRISDAGGNVTSVPKGSAGYKVKSTGASTMAISFGTTYGVESTKTTFQYIDIGLTAKTPPVEGSYVHELSLANGITTLDAGQGFVVSSAGETGKMSVDVLKQNVATKGGFYGDLTSTIVDSLPAGITAWDDAVVTASGNGAYSANIFQSTASRNILLQTKPVMTSTSAGFDYMHIDLPFGSGTPTNIVVLLRTDSSPSANIVYLQDFYDFTTTVSTSDIVIEFTNPIDKTFMDTGAFAKIGETLSATELLVSFDMNMPNLLGQHLFDAFVLNTVTKSNPYYVDVLLGEARGTTLVTVERGIDSVGNVVDGTRFLRINQLPQNGVTATPAVGSVTAALVAVSKGTFLPKDAKRALRLDLAVNATTGQNYDHLELQLPEGFKSVTNIVVVEGLRTLAQYTDYNLESDHNRSVGIRLKSKRSASSTFTVTFDVITPSTLPKPETTYVFGLVVSNEETGTLKTTPVYAQAGKVTALNTSSTLSVLVKDGSVISGTIVLGELPLGLISGNVVLSGNGTGTVYAKTLSFAKGEGSATFDFGLTTADDLTAGVDPGSYLLSFSVLGYQDFSMYVTIVDNKTSVEVLFIQMTPEPVQASLTLSPRYLEANATTSLSIFVNLNVATGTNLNAFDFAINPAAGATGTFSTFVIDAVTAGNSVVNYLESSPGVYSVNLIGVTATSNVVVLASATVPGDMRGDFVVSGTVKSTAGSLAVMSDLDLTLPATITVGSFVAIKTTEIPGAVIGDQYSTSLLSDYSIEKVEATTLKFTAQILDKDGVDVSSTIGLAMTTGGVLSGTPLLLSGSPYTVKATLTANALIAADGLYTTTVDLPLVVTRDAFAFYAAAPTVIPTTGGEFIVKGRGFTSVAKVMVAEQSATVTVVDNETLRVAVGPMQEGSYALSVEDSGVTTSPSSNQQLLVAAASESTQTFSNVIEGEADLADYEIVGLGSFYQGDIKAALESAFGAYDTTMWRAYYYDPAIGHQQVNSLSADSSFTQIRPGTAFWRISREVGTVKTTGVASDLAPEYFVNIPPASWMLITNVYGSDVSWESVSLSTSVNGQVLKDVSARSTEAASIVNPNLYGFDKVLAASPEHASSPYSAVSVMEPGKGYWVQNKWVKDVTLKISRPSAQLAKAGATVRALQFKAGEDLPPQPPETFQKTNVAGGVGTSVGSSASAGGGGGGCLLK